MDHDEKSVIHRLEIKFKRGLSIYFHTHSLIRLLALITAASGYWCERLFLVGYFKVFPAVADWRLIGSSAMNSSCGGYTGYSSNLSCM